MCIYTRPLAILPHGVPPQGPRFVRSVAPGRCIVLILNFGQLLAKESVETWFCSPTTVRHRAVCASVRNQNPDTLILTDGLMSLMPLSKPTACNEAD